MSDIEKIELAIRRVSDRLKSETPWPMDVTRALDMLADALAQVSHTSALSSER